MPATLSAAARLREKVLSEPGTLVLVKGGYTDRILRVIPEPEPIKQHREALRGEKKDEQAELPYVVIDLDKGPGEELWRAVEREIFLRAPRDRALPEPKSCAPSVKEEWNLDPSEVPIISLQGIEIAVPRDPSAQAPGFACDHPGCGKVLKANGALKMHQRTHKAA